MRNVKKYKRKQIPKITSREVKIRVSAKRQKRDCNISTLMQSHHQILSYLTTPDRI